jgi:hypothetical protein
VVELICAAVRKLDVPRGSVVVIADAAVIAPPDVLQALISELSLKLTAQATSKCRVTPALPCAVVSPFGVSAVPAFAKKPKCHKVVWFSDDVETWNVVISKHNN